MTLHGTVALVTGAGRRLGHEIALALAGQGADLLLHVHTSSGEDSARAITALGRQAIILRADLSQPSGASRLSKEALAVAGHVDVLVNNAGVFFRTLLPVLTFNAWQKLLCTNLTSPFVLSLFLGRVMQKRGSGKIIQLGDWSGLRPLPGYLPYCVSKGGLQMLTQALAKVLAPQVQVNVVAPGPVLLPEHYDATAENTLKGYTPLGRIGKTGDVVRTVVFLAGQGRGVTGATYLVDGGWLASPPNGGDTSL